MSSNVNDTLNQGVTSCVTVSPYRAVLGYRTLHSNAATFVNLSVLRGLSSFVVFARGPLHRSPNFTPRHPRRNFFPSLYLRRILHQLPRPIKHQSIPPLQNRQRRKHFQRPAHALDANSLLQQHIPHRGGQRRSPRFHLPANPRQHPPQIVVPHRSRHRLPPSPQLLERLPLAPLQPESQVIHFLLPLPDQVHHPRKSPILRPFHQRIPRLEQPALHCPHQPIPHRLRLILHFHARPDHQFRRRRRCWRPQVCNKIHDCEVRLVTHRGYHRNLRCRHRPRQSFIIERRQIFRRPPAPSHNDHFHAAAVIVAKFVEIPHPVCHFRRRQISLHLRWINHRTHRVMPSPQNIQDVAQRRRLWRCHNPDARWQCRNRF